jgi:hypothetical protein
MQQAERATRLPLAFEVLREELDAIDDQFDATLRASDRGERDARCNDLVRSIDRYLRLEREVLYPVLARMGVEHAGAAASNKQLELGTRRLLQAPDASAEMKRLRSELQDHRREQLENTFPRAARALDAEPGLAAELEEVRSRMKGAFGV